MSATLAAAIISLIGTGIGTFGGILASNRLTVYRLEQLEKKVDKHNSLIERTYKLESEVDAIKEKIKTKGRKKNEKELQA